MTQKEWGIFGGFVALLIGLSIVNHQLAVIVGVGVMGLIFYQYLVSRSETNPQTTGTTSN